MIDYIYDSSREKPPTEDFKKLTSIENLRHLHDVLYLMKEDVTFFKLISYMVKSAIDSLETREQLIEQQYILIKKQEDIIRKLSNDANIREGEEIPEDYRWD